MSIARLENSKLIVQIQEKDHGQLTVVDKQGQKKWQSRIPSLTLHSWNVGEERPRRTTSETSNNCRIVSTVTGKKLSVKYHWQTEGITLDVVYELEEDCLKVSLPYKKIKEHDPIRFRLMSMDLLPGLGEAAYGQQGYFLLPNFCGVRCNFNKLQEIENRHFAYMHQSQWEYWNTYPIFGVQHDDKAGFLAVLDSGEFDAEIVTSLNKDGGKKHWIYPRFHFRQVKTDSIDSVDRIVRYTFLSGNEASYVGMAKAYRKYLLTSRGLRPLKERIQHNPSLAYELTAYSFKIFHAMKSRQIDGQGRYCRFTTFDEARLVISKLKAAGVDRASYQCVGWNPDGHDGKWPTRFPLDERLGGVKGFLQLRDHAASLGHRLGVHDNCVDAYRSSLDWTERNIMCDRDGELYRGGIWGGGMQYLLCNSQARFWLHREMQQMKELGLTGIYYMDAMPRPLRDCFNSDHGHPPTRRSDAEATLKLLQMAREIMDPCPIGTENAFGYTLSDTDYASHLVSEVPEAIRENEFGRYFVDDLVPFAHLAVHGLIKYHLSDLRGYDVSRGVPRESILKEIEYGATPRFEWSYRDKLIRDPGYLHFGDPEPYLPAIVEQYRILCEELGYLQTEMIEAHEQVDNHSFRTTYENGTEVIVDYKKKRYHHEKCY